MFNHSFKTFIWNGELTLSNKQNHILHRVNKQNHILQSSRIKLYRPYSGKYSVNPLLHMGHYSVRMAKI